MEDDAIKKRKLAESEKKLDVKLPPSKDRKDLPPSKIGKPALNASQSVTNSSAGPSKSLKHTVSSATLNSSMSVKLVSTSAVETKQTTLASSSALSSKGKGKSKEASLSGLQPQHVMQAQMQARVQAQLEELRKDQMPAPPGPSENIELPDINSEYSDSDDEDRIRTFDPPEWAQSPYLREGIEAQSGFNPDDIFGAIRPLRMEELFKNRTSRFRARTSSANWAGADRLTIAEETEYARRMGFNS